MKEKMLERINDNMVLLEKLSSLYELPEISEELRKMKQFKLELTGAQNYFELTYHEDGQVKRTYYNSADSVGYWVSRYICFNDIDETYEVTKIVMDNREVSYAGWMPGMRFEYYDNETHEVVAQYEFPEWDH